MNRIHKLVLRSPGWPSEQNGILRDLTCLHEILVIYYLEAVYDKVKSNNQRHAAFSSDATVFESVRILKRLRKKVPDYLADQYLASGTDGKSSQDRQNTGPEKLMI